MKKLYGVIGDPIAHSMSPAMHNDLFEFYGMDAEMFPFHIKGPLLEDAVKGFRAINVAGFNITVPHKTAIMPFLDEIDPLAEAIGAVNTVVNKEGKLIGYNTDGTGYFEGIKQAVSDVEGKTVLLVGAGGAAKAIYYTMAYAGVERIDIANRTQQSAESLIEHCPYKTQSEVMVITETKQDCSEYDIIIQTTSVGMHPRVNETPLHLRNVKEGAFVSDIIYTPLETRFLRQAREQGAITQNGIPMFVYQGALAFEKWMGIFPDADRMEAVVLRQLGGEKC
ncbi:shikimate dehydrogenase [Bacillus benzoevorans]|uniref:Shikimate dehydrogenase (NADP(+)) n=1 Tax=Bacillus benzoevorans TaxID=1456 RepID=A0A7X0HSG0_9BACI|nr:shikimate dehydrogenase [Bacillus benzoevorans]